MTVDPDDFDHYDEEIDRDCDEEPEKDDEEEDEEGESSVTRKRPSYKSNSSFDSPARKRF